MNIPVVLLEEIKAALPPALREKLETAMRKARAVNAKNIKKFRNNYSNNYSDNHGNNYSNDYSNGYEKMLQCNASKNMKSGEISLKTPFLAEKCDNHVSRGGERGGLYLNNSTSVLTLSDNDVTRVDNSSFKNPSLNKGTKRTSLEKNAEKTKEKMLQSNETGCANHAAKKSPAFPSPECAPRHELLRIAMAAGISEEMFHSWHSYGEDTGWRDKSGRPISDWLAALRAYSLKAQIGRAGQ